jgi:sulfite reductase (NADPH) flavoprotein alpha-component
MSLPADSATHAISAAPPPLENRQVKSVCPYCGVGCGIVLQVEAGRVTKVSGDKEHPANFGRLCTKGTTSAQALADSGRMESGYIRASRACEQMPVPVDDAISTAAKRLRGIIDAHWPDAVALYVSGQMSLEAQYLANKLAKGFIRTNNIDSNSRLCMSSAASGYKLSLGADGPPGSYDDFDAADLFFVAGANMADCHPILFLRLLDRKKAGAKLIVVDPRRTATADKADLFLQLRPGTDLTLLNGLLHLLVEAGDIDAGFIAAHTEGWEDMPAFLEEFTPAHVAKITGLREADIRTAAHWIGAARNWMSCWTMGLNQSTQGSWHTNAICNLHLATGAICRTGSGPFSLTGQPNAMGGREVGYLSHGLPGQRAVTNAADREFIEKLWKIDDGSIRAAPGADAVKMFSGLQSGAIKAIWIICTNPVASMPNRGKIVAGLQAAELVIAQDAFLDTETNIYADILLPGALWAEASGVMINSERNLTLMQPAVAPPGEARPDWQIIAQIACAMGYAAGFSYNSSAEIFDEIRLTANPATGYDISGALYEKLQRGPLQWPIAPQGAARNPIRYRGAALRFPTGSGRARFFARPALPPAELPDENFPFVLNTGRLPHQWHTMTKTGKIKTLNKLNPGPFVEVNPEDAAAMGIEERDMVEIRSRRGRAVLPVVVTSRVLPGGCFAPFHWNDVFGDDLAINVVTSDAVDAVSFQPEFKFCAVALAKVQSSAFLAYSQPKQDIAVTHIDPTDPVAAALNFTPLPQPGLSEAETLYLSGFCSALKTPGVQAGVPVLPDTAPLSPPARLWIDGVLAGLYSRVTVGSVPVLPVAAVAAARSVTLLWASQTGNSEALAERLKADLQVTGIQVESACMADYPAGELGKTGTIILISSTYGDGEPPDNGRGFWEFLSEDNAPRLEHLNFAVCGLGDSSYDQFCQHGKNLDARLAALGAQRIAGRLDCDADHEAEIGPWLGLITKRLNVAVVTPQAASQIAYGKNRPYPARLLESKRLNGPGADKDTRFISLSLAEADLRYEAGDALGVWPTNCLILVDEVLAQAGLTDDAMVTVDKAGHLPLRQALEQNFELTRPSRETLEFIAERNGSAELKSLLSTEHQNDLKQFLWGKQLPDILRAFPVRTTAQEFASALKHIQPRLYSIASSPLAHVGEVHLTVSAVRYGEVPRKGACSIFLAERAATGDVPVFVQNSSHFRLPADPLTPIIMIGPGTGIAPFRAFLHERRAQGATGRNWLFFGERHRATDFYYQDELIQMSKDGVLTELSLAFSRDQVDKIYVQQRMLEQGATLWTWLQDGATVYVCGDAAQMAKDVESALLAIIERHGGLARETAQDYLKSLTREKRYLRDVY